METKTYTHLQLHEKFQHIIHHALSDDAEKMKEIKLLFSQEPQIWKLALISAYRHLAEDRMRINQCANAKHDLFQFTQNTLAGNLEFHISQTSPDQFANLVFSNLRDECKITMKADFERVKQCITLAQTHGTESVTGLTLSDMWCLLKGLAFTLLYHPTFFDESRRENMIALMADRVAEDLLGPWAAVEEPQAALAPHATPVKPIAPFGNTLKRTHKPSLSDIWAFIIGKRKPFDAWELTIDGMNCKVLNQWNLQGANCQFLIGDKVVAENHDLLTIKGTTPLLSVQVVGLSGRSHHVEVFCKAILTTNIRVDVNGQPITRRFL